MKIQELDLLYERYGYDLKSNLSSQNYRVYTLNKGVYYGADIVFENKNEDFDRIHSSLSKAGYACREVQISKQEDAENKLFESFFHSNQLKERLVNKYNKFAAQQTSLLKVPYEYIPVSYLIDNEEFKSKSFIIGNIIDKIKSKGAQLIIVEAAAGFGKTCTSYELISYISKSHEKFAPIFTELSRDRKAAIFKHILNDVIINEFHSLLDEKLVVHEIQSGKIPLIIDGFDELLSKEQDTGGDEFEQVETMLSTIGDLLVDNAKIILTGRKTAIFAGDSFQEWIENSSNEFAVSRFLINPPCIEDWLSGDKIAILKDNNIPIKDVANPVLLAFIKSLSLKDFKVVIKSPEQLVNKYFSAILDREQERQELRIQVEDQLRIFENLALAMMEMNITSESKEWIKFLIEEQNKELLDDVRKLYPPAQRPTIDEITNTLSNHALLDRKGVSDQIGFINDFIFGTLIGRCIIKSTQSKISKVSTYMFELASTAFQFQSKQNKEELWKKLEPIERFTKQEKLITEYLLKDEIISEFNEASFSDFSVSQLIFDKSGQFNTCVFANCTFNDCTFKPSCFVNTSFVNCVFHNCEIELNNLVENNTAMFLISCEDYSSGFLAHFNQEDEHKSEAGKDKPQQELIISKFFNKNSPRPRHRKISYLIKDMDSSIRSEIVKNNRTVKKRRFHKIKW
jgi:hypothetical protein